MTDRSENRKSFDIRNVSMDLNVNRYAEGSVLIRSGNTHVLCTASIEERVPFWLEGKNKGWVTGEYSMLPRATHTRSMRERSKVSGRTQEIQRLIGRSLRACVDLKALGPRSITVDCDVLQADGGTRTASITGGCVALAHALKKLSKEGKIDFEKTWLGTVSAISVGIKNGETLVDLDYKEDSSCDVDMNFVVNSIGNFVEVQGTAEAAPFSPEQLFEITKAALNAAKELKQKQESLINS